MIKSHGNARVLLAVAGGAAVIAMGALSGCNSAEQQTPPSTTTTTPSTTSPSAAPTEKSINPTGGNLFTPPVQATPAPTVPPGQHPGINGTP